MAYNFGVNMMGSYGHFSGMGYAADNAGSGSWGKGWGKGGSSRRRGRASAAQPVVPGRVLPHPSVEPFVAELQNELQALSASSPRYSQPEMQHAEAKLIESQRLAEQAAAAVVECLEAFGRATGEVRKLDGESKERVKSINLKLRDLAFFRVVGLKQTLNHSELAGSLCSFLKQPNEESNSQFGNCVSKMHKKFLSEALQGNTLKALQAGLTKRLTSGCEEGQLLAARLTELMEDFVGSLKAAMPDCHVESEPSTDYRDGDSDLDSPWQGEAEGSEPGREPESEESRFAEQYGYEGLVLRNGFFCVAEEKLPGLQRSASMPAFL
eukprot:TRINITY_DN25932_c0_g1_i1.p1 TRINITY_DN25932_c0_g1~~TRINITY_DN25932_c0_g1_i1.p1  ORF type:complete len:324 (+),score=72.33 TRINITY_DN25932_c0_g1_i1:56-1027(+)